MKVLFIGSDREIFVEGSASQERMIKYARLFEELHILVFAKKGTAPTPLKPARNLWVYSTESESRWFYVWNAIKTLKREKVKIDVVSAQDPFESGLAGLMVAKTLDAKLHVQLHTDMFSPYFSGTLNTLRKLISRLVFSKTHSVRLVSKHLQEELLKRYPHLVGMVEVLPIYTDLSKLKEASEQDLRKKYAQFSPKVLLVGRLEKEKNLYMAVDVLQKVMEKHPRIGVFILGEGKERQPLELYIKRKGLEANFVFEGSRSGIASYYKMADLLLHTSFFEGYGRVFIEAVAVHLPMVVSRVGLINNLPKEISGRFCCDPEDRECFISKVLNILENPQYVSATEALILSQQSADFGEYMKAFKKDLERTLN